jgi:hypothetical protein
MAGGNLPIILGAILGVAELMYKQVWAPLMTTAVEKKASAQLKDVLYVQKATPLITAAPVDFATAKSKGTSP